MSRELIVTEDVAATARDRFVAWQPRSVALAGGSTPRAFYALLAHAAYRWDEVEVFFGDERCVPPDDPDSNERMAREALLDRVPARVHAMPGATCDADAYEAELRSVFGPGVPVFDLVILGLGEDGHTASLFPGDRALAEREGLVVRVERPDHPRLTLTLPVLNAARRALFLVTGAAKASALERLLASDAACPAALVSAQHITVIADPEAAVNVRGKVGGNTFP